MKNYFRVTAYHPETNITAIIDCNGKFEKLWQLCSFLIKLNFQNIAYSNGEVFEDGNLPKLKEHDEEHLFLRACMKGKADYETDTITVSGKFYKPNRKV